MTSIRTLRWMAGLAAVACLAAASAAERDKPTPGIAGAEAKASLSMEELRQKLNASVAEASARAARTPVVRVATRASTSAKPAGAGKAHGPGESHAEAAHWAYAGAGGPQDWGHLQPAFATCARGERQSPIDIRGGIRVDLEPIRFDYKPVPFEVVDNGHTVQVNVGMGNAIEVNQRRYQLVQFHFHRPSEERVNGRQYDMVAHLVHKDADGRLAVIAVLIEAGRQHPVIQQVWNSLPLEKNEALAGPAPMDLNKLLPEDRRYYTYMGSLTTPPCTEGVLWLVLKQPVDVAAEQIGVFSRLYPMNARPIQSSAGRLIKESN